MVLYELLCPIFIIFLSFLFRNFCPKNKELMNLNSKYFIFSLSKVICEENESLEAFTLQCFGNILKDITCNCRVK